MTARFTRVLLTNVGILSRSHWLPRSLRYHFGMSMRAAASESVIDSVITCHFENGIEISGQVDS